VPEITAASPRRISCHLDGATIVIDLGADDDPEILYLTNEEARRIAYELEVKLVCKADGAYVQLVVADVWLTEAESWDLVDAIGEVLRLDGPDASRVMIGGVPWQKEGF
jgi:hypothetical protein